MQTNNIDGGRKISTLSTGTMENVVAKQE